MNDDEDDAALIAESEDDLQKLLHEFNTTAKSFNMIISPTKTKCMTTSKTPIRCKLEIDGVIVQQEMKFKYLGIEISSFGDVEAEVREQTIRAANVAGSLNNLIWSNKNIRIEAKSRIYKSTIRPIMT